MENLERRIAGLPIWQGKPKLSPLLGGLSNLSFLAEDRAGKFVVRSGKDYPFHHVFRDRELMSARAAYAAGFAPEVVYAEPGLMVSRFIDGKVFGETDVRDNLERVALLLRGFHDRMPLTVTGTAFIFWAFHVVRDYANTLKGSSNPLTARLPELLKINSELEAAQTALPIKFGHNDLLPANIIDDGKRLWLIDFEYAGFGTAMFDLAGVSSNAGFDTAQSEALLDIYFGSTPDTGLMASQAGMQCASLLREALWALVSEMYLNVPGADYDAYARQNFTRFDAALTSYRTLFSKD